MKELIKHIETGALDGRITGNEVQIILRALRLLAAAEDNDGTKAEVLPSFIAIHLCSDYTRGKCGDPAYDDCCCQKLVRGYEQINNERNGLAARVAELEKDEARLRFLADEPLFDQLGEIDLHEEAAINSSALGRDEPNSNDYLAAIRTAIDAARSKP